ncbi:PREDICTED: probable G-protein coupled receptor 176 [Chrysochloris asiatica]|uniref:Probable G-protein coupled receptor 176 n=1 Tax=Chrysochloris asiatica TaxID=185453 RepID=A0A9B0WGZ1_CHRAS|nr:PREDICTED: probable G-protein coupled receptor 176 [Chrysochloris asiatica]
MGHNGSWVFPNASEPRNASGAEAAGANRSAPGEFGEAQLYRQFTTTVQIVIFVGSLLGNFMVLWSTCRTTVFKSVTNRFIKNLACSGICANLVCVPFDIILSTSPHCCWWIYTMGFCKVVKFLHKVFCSVTILSFPAIALDRYYSVLYPLERKISDAKSRELVMYIWAHAVVASIPVFAVTNVADIYAMSTCTEVWSYSMGHLVYALIYNITTVFVPVVVAFLFLMLIRRALSASQKKKVIIAALRTPQNTISIPYASQREAELHTTLVSMVMVFLLCSVPYVTLVIYQTVLNIPNTSVFLLLTAIWLPKVSLLANPVLFLTVNKSVRKCLMGTLVQLHHRYSRRNVVSTGSGVADASLEPSMRSGSQLLEMFHIGQQQIFKPTEDEEESEAKYSGSADLQPKEIMSTSLEVEQGPQLTPTASPPGTVDSTSQVTTAVPVESETVPDKYSLQFGFGPFELPPQWLSETRNSKKRLLPPLGNTPEELIQTKMPKVGRVERKMSRNNKVSIFPKVDS